MLEREDAVLAPKRDDRRHRERRNEENHDHHERWRKQREADPAPAGGALRRRHRLRSQRSPVIAAVEVHGAGVVANGSPLARTTSIPVIARHSTTKLDVIPAEAGIHSN